MHSTTKNPQVELISLPVVLADREEKHSTVELSFSEMIRVEELKIMRHEDERRRMYLTELSLEQSMNLSQNLFQSVTSAASSQAAKHSSNISQADDLNTPDIDFAFSFLAKPRQLQMNDRTPKLYTFVLTNFVEDQSQDLNLALEWTDSDIVSRTNASGYVLIEDITAIRRSDFDSHIFMIAVKESVKALKNSKGRTTLSVRCNSSTEAMNYMKCLTTVYHGCF
jgi:hypothetical protein